MWLSGFGLYKTPYVENWTVCNPIQQRYDGESWLNVKRARMTVAITAGKWTHGAAGACRRSLTRDTL
jgi:hypothetical protein